MTSDQERVVSDLASQHGGCKVLRYSESCCDVIACGWVNDTDGGHRVSPWVGVFPSGTTFSACGSEVAFALELADRVAYEQAVVVEARDAA